MKTNSNSNRCIFIVVFFHFFLIFISQAFCQSNSNWTGEFSSPEPFWGAETNGIKMGLIVSSLAVTNNISIRCTPIIVSGIKSTNRLNTVNIYYPPRESCFQIRLLDESGKAVPKTDKGKLLGKPITEPLMVKIGGLNYRAGYSLGPIVQNHPQILSSFSFGLQDYFEITNSGKFRLTFEMRIILRQSTNGNFMAYYTPNFPTTTLPSVTTEVEVSAPASK